MVFWGKIPNTGCGLVLDILSPGRIMYRIVHYLFFMDKKTLLLKQKRKIFSIDDLALIWGVENRNTLRVTIRRYIQNNTLIRMKRGLYSIIPLNELNPFLFGVSYIKGFCYVSLQTVLEINGFINQSIQLITLVGGRSQEFKLNKQRYVCKKMKPEYLNNIEGIDLSGEYPIASAERAVADMLYFNSRFHFDAKDRIDWDRVKNIEDKVFI